MRALAVAASALLLTGCFKIDMQLDVAENDTVGGEMVLALSRDVSAMAESMGEDPSSMFGEMDDLPEGTEVEDYEDDRFVGQRYIFEDVPLSEFSEGQEFSIVHEGEEIVVTGSLDMTDMNPEDMAGELGELGGGEELPFGDMDQLMDSLELRVAITFPGEVTEHNGELDGTTVTWTPVPGEVNEISARSADSGGGGGDGIPAWIWILIVVVVLGLAALLFFLSRNRNQAPPADAATAGAVPPPPGTAPDAGAAPAA
ncbi:LppM family (lipo)protein, partial [Jiangella rhizosphaerae]